MLLDTSNMVCMLVGGMKLGDGRKAQERSRVHVIVAVNLELQFSMDGYNHVGFILYFMCVYSVIHIGLPVHQCTWYMYKMLTGLHEQMEKLTNCLPHCPRMNNIP